MQRCMRIVLTAVRSADPAFQKKPEEEKPKEEKPEEEKPHKVTGTSADEPDYVTINRAPTLTLWVCSSALLFLLDTFLSCVCVEALHRVYSAGSKGCREAGVQQGEWTRLWKSHCWYHSPEQRPQVLFLTPGWLLRHK